MPYKRYLIEIGTGIDLHGRDVTKAAIKAIKDAISHSCMCGLHDLLNIEGPANHMKIKVRIGSTEPERVDTDAVAKAIPFGIPEIEVVSGGLSEKGLHEPSLGEGDTITVAIAILTVWIDTDAATLR